MHWSVLTPKYIEYYSTDSLEPPEEVVDYVCVEAETRRQALVQGLRELRAIKSAWLDDKYSNPFKGLMAIPNICHHGRCMCELPKCVETREFDVCPDCEAEWDEELSAEA